MLKDFLNNLLRSIGRVPEEGLDEIRKKKEEREKAEERRYIKLMGEGDCEIEELPDEIFDDDDEDEAPIRTPEEEKRDRLIGDVYFFSVVLLVGAFVFGVIVLLTRIIAFPFFKRISDDLDW